MFPFNWISPVKVNEPVLISFNLSRVISFEPFTPTIKFSEVWSTYNSPAVSVGLSPVVPLLNWNIAAI